MNVDKENDEDYSINVANKSFEWYRKASISARRLYRLSEVSVIVISALVPLSAVLFPENAVFPAILGSVVVVITGLRAVFHWHENYLRFSRARERVEEERRRYRVGSGPYADSITCGASLVEAVTRIEQEEMGNWLQIAAAPSQLPKPSS